MVTFLNMWDGFANWDRKVFRIINGDWSNSFFDAVLPWLRQPYVWAPLYLFVLIFVVANHRKNSGWWVIFFIITVAMADMIGTYVFKHNVQRLRPCFDPELADYIRLRIKSCAGGYSFTSNHAANHFGMATFFFITLRKLLPRWAWVGFPWAFAIIYAQVYTGVHYPLDVICGALLGIISGLFTGYTFNKQFGFAIFGNQSIAAS